MNTVFSVLAGLVWGAAAALLNAVITKKLMNGDQKGIMFMNLIHGLVDFAALGLVFLLRHVLPLKFEFVLIATASAMSIVTIVTAYRLGAGGDKK